MKIKTQKLVLIAFSILAIYSCSKKEVTATALPSITKPGNSDVSNITDTTASVNVTITSEGSSPITAKGVCWSTSHNPTIADNKTSNRHSAGSNTVNKTNDISANLTFTATLTGLTPHTTYYVRVYATNSSGTSYSEEITIVTSIITDIDGNVYNTVVIGNQEWMLENLKTTHYNDGTPIPTGLNDSVWHATKDGAYAIYDNNAANDATYGKLYNWYAVKTGKLAPSGWHVPSDSEWTALTDYLGGVDVAGDKMKATTLWTAYSGITNTNSSGFTGLPAGLRNTEGAYLEIGTNAYFWASTGAITAQSWVRELHYNASEAHRNVLNMVCGFSVRCVKD